MTVNDVLGMVAALVDGDSMAWDILADAMDEEGLHKAGAKLRQRQITHRVMDMHDEGEMEMTIFLPRTGAGFFFPGYGDMCSGDDFGMPVVIEYTDGVPKVAVWADINQEETTHYISLRGAAVGNRLEENQ